MNAEVLPSVSVFAIFAIRRDKQRCLFMGEHANFKLLA